MTLVERCGLLTPSCALLCRQELVRTLPFHQPSREMTRRCSITIGDNARHNGRIVAVGLLQQALSAGGKIIGHVGPSETEAVVVDHVEVGLLAQGYDAAVAETGGIGSIACQPTYQLFNREAPTLATPVCQQPCGKARIQDETNVGTAIAKSHDCVSIGEHGLGGR